MQITFILVRPVVPENIGFVCRCIYNMGFDSLRIVESDKQLHKGAFNTAYETHHILEKILSFDKLEDAVSDLDLVIGTTGKEFSLRNEYLEIRKIKPFLKERKESLTSVGIVFGSESDGLKIEEQNLCDILSSIPMAQDYPSINLSHSVMLYAYELSQIKEATNTEKYEEIKDPGLFKAYKEQVDDFLVKLGVQKRQPGLYQQVKDRLMHLKPDDVNLFMTLARYLRNVIK